MQSLSNELDFIVQSSKLNASYALDYIGLLFVIHIVNAALGYRLNFLGIHPRHLLGLPGIILAPFLHGSWNHLFFNAVPLFIFINMLLTQGPLIFMDTSLCIILVSGSLIWLIGRPGIHVGASATIMGYWGYFLASAYTMPGSQSIILGVICLYYFSGLISNLLPSEKGVSWEGHICGCIAGLLTAWLPFEYHLINLF
ncbi:MAG TPA: rhomboid family intramembrane serine protease [Gammaproteobacteria bacterium]|nr:rhomboid family intramembrane serine protease [Gammaproteobacteria bacterium]